MNEQELMFILDYIIDVQLIFNKKIILQKAIMNYPDPYKDLLISR